MHKNTKYWAFTWETNVFQKELPNKEKLKRFLNNISNTCIFQLECGKLKKKKHFQGTFELIGPRQSKKAVLELFEEHFKNVSGLTLSKVYDKEAIMNYVQKEETRIEGPFFVGKKEKFDENYSRCELRPWQKDLYDYLIENKDNKLFRDRTIIWVEDKVGNTGKSFFQKWLRIGQRVLRCRKLPISTVERLISAVTKLNEKDQIDLYMINLTRSRGENQSLKDLFAAIEDIKDGYIVDTLYGKYVESIFNSPLVVIFSNQRLSDYEKYLSVDRWQRLVIDSDYELLRWTVETSDKIGVEKIRDLINKEKK